MTDGKILALYIPLKTGAVFAACGALASITLPVSHAFMYLGFVSALLLPPLAFMVGGAIAGANVDRELPKAVPRFAGAFTLVGIGSLASSIITHHAESGVVFFGGGGSVLIGFGMAGLIAMLGSFSERRSIPVVLAFALGGVIGASACISARLFVQLGETTSAMIGAIVGLGATGILMAWRADGFGPEKRRDM